MANGIVLTGEVRNVKVVTIRPKNGGESFDQTQAIFDTGADYLPRVVFRKDDGRSADQLRAQVGDVVSIQVSLSQYGNIYFDGFAD